MTPPTADQIAEIEKRHAVCPITATVDGPDHAWRCHADRATLLAFIRSTQAPPADDVVDLTLALELVDIQDEDGMHKLVQASYTQSLAKQVIALAEKLKVRAATPSARVTREALVRTIHSFFLTWQSMKIGPLANALAIAISKDFPGLVEDTTP